jgi:hypothetical protein
MSMNDDLFYGPYTLSPRQNDLNKIGQMNGNFNTHSYNYTHGGKTEDMESALFVNVHDSNEGSLQMREFNIPTFAMQRVGKYENGGADDDDHFSVFNAEKSHTSEFFGGYGDSEV